MPKRATLLTVVAAGAVLVAVGVIPKFWPLLPVRLAPLWICVMPESCQPIHQPARELVPSRGLPSSME